ncbi:class I adenylate-forming enzyme family protein [Bordetella avium]|uniref:class I adenylate-forming enzyme family protein n=1 Tax=Bordetella avium TaxID=521 RepID=UPI000E6A6644|nr:AMP-binding protein [Bordetella avium]RIQ39489.1 long-chain fatty acid--CoA ligase [Bordetella avium]RIQ44288.1 long-chain fatty acid--CoA ligase [Bordetella avium]RIQ45494.1 long-chain fatty acid--CoA ligase [Bordetella avium]RIQ51327.1 long-chain fatty acid--CoA ligase [Bordetella avium]RIQ62637.1 long-chain fatty acid--CoA ligase [Bordetella avium]
MPNIYQVAMFNAERHPGKTAISDSQRALTFAQLCARARALAHYLTGLGVAPGDRVAIMAGNSIDYLALLHATAIGGFAIVPVNTRYGLAELDHLLRDAEPKVFIYDAAHQALVDTLSQDDALPSPPAWLDALPADLADPHCNDPVTRRFGKVGDDDVALIMYTSGTTSTPKGAMLTHGNLSANAVNYIMELGIDAEARSLLATPLFHIGGFGVVNGPILYAGGSLHILPRFDIDVVIQALAEQQPTHIFLLSTMWVGLTDHPDFGALILPSAKFVQTAAAPLGEWRQALIRKVFPNAEFSWGFGMTESCVTTIKNRYTREILEHPGSIGYLWRHVQYRLVDSDGQVLPDQRGPGELQVRGPTIFKGYWKQPALTAQVLDPQGWLHTGDLIRIDDDGFSHFLGRSKDMIKTGGENVAALEVENCLTSHTDVREAAAFGVPHEYWGEELVAAVVPAAGRMPGIDALREHCRAHLSGFKVPKRIFIVDALPQSSSGKVQKFRLKEQFIS